VIPLKDVNPTRRPAVITILIIVACALVFGYQQSKPDDLSLGGRQGFVCEYGFIPEHALQGTVDRADACQVLNAEHDRALGVVSSLFLHADILHIAFNMLFLWVFGNNVEDMFGRLKFLVFYLFCGYVATYGFAIGNADTTTTLVGASGAIAGVLGAYLVLFPRARVTSLVPFLFFIPVWLPAWVVLGSWFVLQWLYFQGAATAEGAGVAYLAHVVGFAAGVVLIILFGGLRARRPPPPPAWYYQQR
jgi:membrane associated rhomboid family serine protease